jgi:hypothetical protein
MHPNRPDVHAQIRSHEPAVMLCRVEPLPLPTCAARTAIARRPPGLASPLSSVAPQNHVVAGAGAALRPATGAPEQAGVETISAARTTDPGVAGSNVARPVPTDVKSMVEELISWTSDRLIRGSDGRTCRATTRSAPSPFTICLASERRLRPCSEPVLIGNPARLFGPG